MSKRLMSIMALTILFINMLSLASKIQTAEADQTINVTGSPPWGDWSHYHNYTEIENTLIYLNNLYPNIVDVFPIGKSWQNQTIYCIRLTNETNIHPKPKLLFVGYHHAREPISLELPLYFATMAADQFGTNQNITRMLNYTEIYIVPALNVDGIEVFRHNDWQRKNAHPFDDDNDGLFDEDPPYDLNGDGRVDLYYLYNATGYYPIGYEGVDTDLDGTQDWIGGVDLNRNYGYQWNATCDSGSDIVAAEDFRGLAPFSEPETRAIRDLAMQNDFKYAISYHSGTENILYPWGYAHIPTADDQTFREIASNLSALTGAPYEQAASMYTTSGVWDDWMYQNRSTLAFTCEIYSNNSAWHFEPINSTIWREYGIGQAFNPDPASIMQVIQRWLPTFTYLIDRAITEAYDIAITSVTPTKTLIQSGTILQVNTTLANRGYFNETFNVSLKANSTTVQTYPLSLQNDTQTTLSFQWDTTGYALGNYLLSADASILSGETNTADNTYLDGVVQIATPPTVTISLPENKTYAISSIPLSFTLDQPASWIGYSLDDAANVTITGNTTLTSVSDGTHHIIVYAYGSGGFMGASNTVHFTIDTVPPNITSVTQNPPKDNVQPTDEVKVNATVIDVTSGIKQATLVYAYTNATGTWIKTATMTHIEGSIWTATIPAFPYCTNVTYMIMAEDNAGNPMTTEEFGYMYHVVPELSLTLMLPLFMIMALLATAYRKKRSFQV